MSNIVTLVINKADDVKEKLAIIDPCGQISYEKLVEKVRETALYLSEKGIKKGDRVLIFIPMSVELYKIILAVFYLGATAVFLDSWADKKRFEQAIKTASCTAFIGIPKAHLLRLRSKELRAIPLKLIANFNSFKPVDNEYPSIAEVSEEDVALITFTTGSSGVPKAAKRTHYYLMEQHKALTAHLKPDPDDIDHTTLPVFALNNLACGITTVVSALKPRATQIPDIHKIFNDFDTRRVSSTSGSPAFYSQLADYCLMENRALTSLKKIFLGGAPVFPRLASKLLNAFPQCQVEIIYGSTEAEPISSMIAQDLLKYSDEITVKGLPVGIPVDNIEVRILKIIEGPIETGNVEAFNKLTSTPALPGEVCIAGDHVLKEYYNDDRAQKLNKINVDGKVWHRTGDAGYINPDGTLYLLGRVKNRFMYKGKQYFVFPFENALSEIEDVDIGTIMPVKDTLYLIVKPHKKARLSREKLQARARKLKIPFDEILIVKEIPRDPRHKSKIDYDRLKETLSN